MNTDTERENLCDELADLTLKHGAVTKRILRVFYEVYNDLGHGFVESVYQRAMLIALVEDGLQVRSELPLPVRFRGRNVGDFRADIVVNDAVLIELKAAEHLDKPHEVQVLNYLRACELEVGLLLNFGPKPGFRRFIFNNDQKKIRVNPRSSVLEGA